MKPNSMRIVISGGGTGGHIFPAIAIADTIRNRYPDADILFVGAKGRMEMDRVPKAGYRIEGLWISGFQRRFSLSNFVFPFKVMNSLLKARKILKKFNPDVVVGVGGYASGPTLRAAVQLQIPVLIQEQNSFPGVTNRLLGKKAACICVAYDQMEKWFPAEKTVLTGNPLRVSAVAIEGKRDAAFDFFGCNPSIPTIVIVGGSQGALGINKALSAQLEKLAQANVQMLWQTGTNYLETAKAEIEKLGCSDKIKAVAFIDRMDFAYAMANLVVSRAGAMAISELAVVAKPVIFVPLPTAAEDHQTKNALRLVEAQAARLVTNSDAPNELVPEMLRLIENELEKAEMAQNIAVFARRDAAEQIVNQLEKLV
ncbi:MAG: undecaprenyldiphospho-muramoylpentapeptide beta-N-acetylglucosaminyltransferase [Lentimicrobiaceae bacterium]|jgi:UDP-N-acetylglucosamine--N-acetylmuramyl-(pentapeptide) pyrophosphoryl-undecaprenol N-acetylglucosamine transferase|nr:undecaprenyldiphospho-muramoylpentapeptide beta-N-acetylglucosaminyltransferase [Lentimicrobiaceae bacterium]